MFRPFLTTSLRMGWRDCAPQAKWSSQHGAAQRPVSSAAAFNQAAAQGVKLPVVWHPAYSAPQLPPGHRFPMGIFARIYGRLLDQGLISRDQVHVPQSLPTEAQLLLVHDAEYLAAFSAGTLDDARVRRIGFGAAATASAALIERTKAEVGGTLLTARLALQHGLAVNTAGGTHHAHRAFGSGFCILNDIAVTCEVLLAEGAVQRVLVLDLDVHQGDGNAAIFTGRQEQVFTLSFHCESNFPARKALSTLDVPLPDGIDDTAYLSLLSSVLPSVLRDFRPDLVIYDAGVDVHVDDTLGRAALTDDGLRRRELQVLDTCLGSGIPVAGLVGGGYATDLEVLAERHMWLHRAALRMWGDHC